MLRYLTIYLKTAHSIGRAAAGRGLETPGLENKCTSATYELNWSSSSHYAHHIHNMLKLYSLVCFNWYEKFLSLYLSLYLSKALLNKYFYCFSVSLHFA